MTKRAAVYARISRDGAGEGLGVKRQESDCRAFCQRRGWQVADVLVDNDMSAYSGKRRPQYARLLDGLESGDYDSVVVWHPDRLHRSPAELETFIELVERTNATVATVTAGDYDLATPEGRLTARIVGSVARKESEDKSRRLRRKHLELADAGKISGGGRRPFGYEADRLTVRTDEADEIRQAAAKILGGESLRSIVADWRDRGIATVTGADWSPTTVKRLLMSARISGQREHHGRIVGAAAWPAIVTADETLRLRSILTNPERSKRSGATVRSYLLTGFVVCAQCGARAKAEGVDAPTMSSRPVIRKGHRYRRYICPADRGGCGRVGIVAEPLEELIVDAMFKVLDSPQLAKIVAKRSTPKGGKADTASVVEIEGRLAELAEMFAAGEISRAEWITARESLERRLDAAKATLSRQTTVSSTDDYVGRSQVLRAEWPAMSIDRKRAILASVIDRIEIASSTRANNKFDSSRVWVAWVA